MHLAKSAVIAPIIGGVLGAALFLAVLGPEIVRPSNLGWLMRHDYQTHFLGWHHFRREPWQWPPGAIVSVGYPVGTSIGNADAVPLVAFLLKPLHGVLPDPLQYLGAWLLACFTLQGVFGALLMRQVTADPALQILGAALFIQTPALFNRTGHVALCAHWMVLAAVWLSHDRQPRHRAARAAWVLLCAAVAATQPYLAVLLLGLALAAIASDALEDPRGPWRVRPVADVAVIVGVMASVFWLSGYFLVGSTSDLGLEGVGFYSMNLLAPVIAMGYSTLLPSIPAGTPGQYEGFLYFGAGWLALGAVAAALLLARRAPLPRLRLGWLVVLVFTLLAVSPVITAGPAVLADWRAWSPSALSVFRSSGRFGWLTMYVAFLVVMAAVTRLPRRAAMTLLLGAVVLQVVDLRGAYRAIGAREHSPAWTTWDDPLKSPVWAVALPQYRHLVMVPPDMCASTWPNPAGPHLPFSLLAARHAVTVNSGNAGRYDVGAVQRYCLDLEADMRSGRLDDDSFYVVSSGMRAVMSASAPTRLLCGDVDGFGVCATASTYARWREAAERLDVSLTP